MARMITQLILGRDLQPGMIVLGFPGAHYCTGRRKLIELAKNQEGSTNLVWWKITKHGRKDLAHFTKTERYEVLA